MHIVMTMTLTSVNTIVSASLGSSEPTYTDSPERSRRGHLNEIDEAVTQRDREALAPVWSVAEADCGVKTNRHSGQTEFTSKL